jgi:hypothetical protein
MQNAWQREIRTESFRRPRSDQRAVNDAHAASSDVLDNRFATAIAMQVAISIRRLSAALKPVSP